MAIITRYDLKIKGVDLGKNVKVFGKVILVGDPKNLKIGNNSYLNHGTILNCRNKIIIGNNVHISSYVQVHTAYLDKFTREHRSLPISIEDNVWIASGSIISSGINIGKNSIIGAGSVVVKDIPSNVFAAGNPARIIKNLVENSA